MTGLYGGTQPDISGLLACEYDRNRPPPVSVARMIGHIVPAGSTEPMDDNQAAAATGMNRAYVNQSCRHLAAEGIIVRQRGSGGKLRTTALDPDAARQAAHITWQIIAAIKVSTRRGPRLWRAARCCTTSCLT
jgi:hypothetical protein